MNDNEEQKFGSYILVGFAIGGITGMVLQAGSGNTFFGFWIGALVGVFLGWFIAVAVSQNKNRKRHNK